MGVSQILRWEAESLTLNRTLRDAVSTVGQKYRLGQDTLLLNGMGDPSSNHPLRPEWNELSIDQYHKYAVIHSPLLGDRPTREGSLTDCDRADLRKRFALWWIEFVLG